MKKAFKDKIFLSIFAILLVPASNLQAKQNNAEKVKKQPVELTPGEKQLISYDNITAKTYNRGTQGDGVIFMPKGNMSVGIKFAYSNQKDHEYASISSDSKYNGQIKSLSLTPQIFYTFKHNSSVGIQFGYESSVTNADNMPQFASLGFNLGDDISKSRENYKTYTGRIAYYHYNPIANSRRFAIIMGGYIGAGGGTGKIQTTQHDYANDRDVTEINDTKNFTASVYFSPGLAVAISKIMMFEVNLDAFGFEYYRVSHMENGTERGYESNTQFSFKPNLFSLKFGVSIQIPLF